jgi:hypothetical protein
MPTGRLIGKAVFDHQTDRQSHNAVGVMALRQSHVRHFGVEVDVALGAVMDRIRKMDIVRPARGQVAEIVQHPLRATMPIRTVFALRTQLSAEIPTALDDLWLGQVLDTRDAFGGIAHVFAWSRHGKALRGSCFQAGNLAQMPN